MHRSSARLATVAAVLVLTACGGGDDSDDDAGASDSATPSDSLTSSTTDPSASPTSEGRKPDDSARPNRSDRPGGSSHDSDDPDSTDEGDEVDDPTRKDLRSALLTRSAMPAGWSEVPTDGDGSGDLCDIDIADLLGVPERSLRKADVQYALDEDAGPSVVESIGLVPAGRAPELLEGLRARFDDCDGEEVQGMSVTVSELDLPTLGDDSAAYEIHVDTGQGSIDIPLVYAISDDLVIGVYAIDVSADPVDLLEEYAPRAVDKAIRVLG